MGGGIVGLATAMALVESRVRSVIVLEAEDRLAAHQSGHNTGIVHSGIFYRPGTLKARLCVEGRELMLRFCEGRGVRHERCGKVVVARGEEDLPGLATLEAWAESNGLRGVRRLEPAEVREYEPHAGGAAGLHVPEAGIADYAGATRAMADVVRAAGGTIRTGARVVGVRRDGGGFALETGRGVVRAGSLANCAGLQSDRVARLCGFDPGVRVVPFRGQFYGLVPGRRHLVRDLIYPVPDLALPFLGEHLTRTVGGEVEGDPNGALCLDRGGYRRGSVSIRDAWEVLSYRGFWRLALRHLRTGLREARRASSRRAFAGPLRRMIPELRPEDLRPTRAGVHAQAVAPDGDLPGDFLVPSAGGAVHVLNATSPAATSSIALGRLVAGRLAGAGPAPSA